MNIGRVLERRAAQMAQPQRNPLWFKVFLSPLAASRIGAVFSLNTSLQNSINQLKF
jgi:hypothetical protein